MKFELLHQRAITRLDDLWSRIRLNLHDAIEVSTVSAFFHDNYNPPQEQCVNLYRPRTTKPSARSGETFSFKENDE